MSIETLEFDQDKVKARGDPGIIPYKGESPLLDFELELMFLFIDLRHFIAAGLENDLDEDDHEDH